MLDITEVLFILSLTHRDALW